MGRMKINCSYCKTIVYRYPCRIKMSQRQYCSIECKNLHQKITRIGVLAGKKHPMYGKHHNEKTKLKNRLSHIGKRLKAENPAWKGNEVGYMALHDWIRRHKPKSDMCENCKQIKKLELANISGEYKRDIDDFKWLCKSCHNKRDKKLLNDKHDKLIREMRMAGIKAKDIAEFFNVNKQIIYKSLNQLWVKNGKN